MLHDMAVTVADAAAGAYLSEASAGNEGACWAQLVCCCRMLGSR